MEFTEIVAVVALILSLLLLIKVFSLQSQLNDVKSDLEWMNNRPNNIGMMNSSSNKEIVSQPKVNDVDADLEERLRFMVASNQKIKAIKVLREARNLSLKDAKDYVDQLERDI
ncbi:ribosomal protein L7/L12 [Paenibacillus sp. EC2-1]|uniref:ribosomal protein L7/L12 n=1 Tax=Paenibacillus sp. EC2-1 TaxID=3388665 RepID=UPI003BEEBF04